MRSDRLCALLGLALAACGGFRRGEPWDESTTTADTGATTTVDGPSFATDILPLLVDGCADCHAPGASAGDTDLVLVDVADDDLPGVLDLVDPANPADSRLLTKAAGSSHVGGAIFTPGGAEYEAILAWIAAGTPP